MKDLLVLWHLGLGDHIICNGLIRSISNNYSTIFLPIKHHNIKNISDLFKDLKNIRLISVTDDHDMIKYYNLINNRIDEVLKIGIFGNHFMKNCDFFDESFYKQARVDYEDRWNKFKYCVEDDKQLKIEQFTNKDFVFVHDDYTRGLNIKEQYLNNPNIYRPQHNLGTSVNNTIFQYYNLLHKAKEIHCMDSAFAGFIDHLPSLKDKPKFIHRYIRKESNNPKYINNWNILND